jgi:glycosyltransferase involved in cell wall biosynthesis
MLIGIDANEANVTRRVGVNQYAFDLLHTLNRLDLGHDFTIYLKEPPSLDMPPEKKNWEYRFIPFPKFWTQTRLPWDLFTHFPRPDVFFTPSHYAPRFSPVPTVISIMDLGFLKSPDQFTHKDFNQLKNWTAYSAKNAAKIIAISEYTKKDILNVYHRRPEDVVVTLPGYDMQLFKPTRNPGVLEKYGIHKSYILFIGSLKPSKNIEGLIRAFSRLDEPDLDLVITGKKGWLYDRIFQLVSKLKIKKEVIITGFVPETDVPVLMSSAKAFVLPSFYEGFGIPVLEAMACGVPVVVSDVASLPEVAGTAGIYVKPADIESITAGIKTALGPGREKYIKQGFIRAACFDWERTAKETISVLESAI